MIAEQNEVMQAITLTRVLRASKQRVFDAWTQPERMRQWFGPARLKVILVESDARPGGSYRIEMQAHDGSGPVSVATGVYREFLPWDRLSYTWNASWATGEESLVTVSLREVSGGTEISVRHEGFLYEASHKGHTGGWQEALVKLESLLG